MKKFIYLIAIAILSQNVIAAEKSQAKINQRKIASAGDFTCRSTFEDGSEQLSNFNVEAYLKETCDSSKSFSVFYMDKLSKKDVLEVCCIHK